MSGRSQIAAVCTSRSFVELDPLLVGEAALDAFATLQTCATAGLHMWMYEITDLDALAGAVLLTAGRAHVTEHPNAEVAWCPPADRDLAAFARALFAETAGAWDCYVDGAEPLEHPRVVWPATVVPDGDLGVGFQQQLGAAIRGRFPTQQGRSAAFAVKALLDNAGRHAAGAAGAATVALTLDADDALTLAVVDRGAPPADTRAAAPLAGVATSGSDLGYVRDALVRSGAEALFASGHGRLHWRPGHVPTVPARSDWFPGFAGMVRVPAG